MGVGVHEFRCVQVSDDFPQFYGGWLDANVDEALQLSPEGQ